MPTYQYRCTDCGHEFEEFQSFTDDALTVCPTCGGTLRKVFNAVGVVFKGSGFYRTDSRSSEKSGSSSATKESPASGSSDAGSSGSSGGSSDSGSSSTTTKAPASTGTSAGSSSAGGGSSSASD